MKNGLSDDDVPIVEDISVSGSEVCGDPGYVADVSVSNVFGDNAKCTLAL